MEKQREWHLADDGTIWEATEQGTRVICRCEDLDDDAVKIWATLDLLAACEAVKRWIEDETFNDLDELSDECKELLSIVRAAVAKATGSTP